MGKYLFRYLIFWLPAAVAVYFFSGGSFGPAYPFQWFGACFLVLGWSVNTGMLAYHHPRNAFALLMGWLGCNILIITALYRTPYQSTLHWWLRNVGGAFSFQPLNIFIEALLDFQFKHELVVTCALAACCFVGWLWGAVYRWIRPNPYRPKIYRPS